MAKRNNCLDHQIISYPSLRNFKIIIAYAATQGLSKSQAVNKMVGDYIDKNFNQSQQQRLMQLFEKMDNKERKRTKKVDTDSKVIIGYFEKGKNDLRNVL